MSKITVEDEDMGIIPENERVPELEDEVLAAVHNTADVELTSKLYKRVEEEHFDSVLETKMWQREEIRRCREGHDGLSPKMYFYFHYCKITNIEEGIIVPDFRTIDHEWFKAIEKASTDHTGIICVKRRRVGASWKEAADVLHDCSFKKHFFVAMNSMSEIDSVELFKKVKFLYSNLPHWLRATVQKSNKMYLDFSYILKDQYGNPILRGTQSEILCKAPTDSAFEGLRISKWVCDEAGKLDNLKQMWTYTLPCMMQETRRLGTPILFGTSGEVSGAGKDLAYMWAKHHAFRLDRFFFAGYHGIIYDEKGNDLKEDAIRWIIYERARLRELDPKTYNDFIQQYPLTTEEAFQPASVGGVGNQIKVVNQEMSLQENPPTRAQGYFVDQGEGVRPKFITSKKGKCLIYEHPAEDQAYLAGCDPADHDEVFEGASDLSLYIMKPQVGAGSPYVVFEYTDRPEALNDYYSQAMLALKYYNHTKVLVEKNRYRFISYFKDRDEAKLLHWTPQGVLRLYATKRPAQIGINMTPAAKEYLEGCIAEYVDDYCELIPSVELLEEFKQYGAQNTDRAIAFGLCLILLKERSRMRNRPGNFSEGNLALPRFDYKRNNQGQIVKVYK